jgi:hypothetical protein
MATLTFPVDPAGLLVDVAVNLEGALLVPLRSGGGGPSPVQGRGLIDTGSDVSAVALPILQRLAIPPVQRTTTQSIGGSLPVNLYRVSLHILDARNIGQPWLSQPALLVMELAYGFPFDALIGLDVLLTCKTLVDGPARRFTLEF